MKIKTINKTNEALHNILKAVELEMCVLDIAERLQYEEYFNEIEVAIAKTCDRFNREWIHNNDVSKNGSQQSK